MTRREKKTGGHRRERGEGEEEGQEGGRETGGKGKGGGGD